MNPIKKGKAIVRAAKTVIARRSTPKKPMDLTPLKETGLKVIKSWAKTVPARATKAARNGLLGLSKDAGRAMDDTYDLIKNGKKKLTRREFLAKAGTRAKEYNTEKINAIVPEPVRKRVEQITREAQGNKYNYSSPVRITKFTYFQKPSANFRGR